jgi:hypothetical protein
MVCRHTQITDALIDDPQAVDNAISKEVATIKAIEFPVGGEADAAGIVLGEPVPSVLISRADTPKAGLATCVVAVAHVRRYEKNRRCDMNGAISVVNGGSSSIKFSLFNSAGDSDLKLIFHGEVDGIGVAPAFTVKNAHGDILVEQTWPHRPEYDHEHLMNHIIELSVNQWRICAKRGGRDHPLFFKPSAVASAGA